MSFDIDYLKKISSEFNNPVNLLSNYDSLVNYVQYMIDNNQMIFVEKNFKLNDMLRLINNLIKSQNLNCIINENEITITDDEIIKLRRKDNVINDFHDLAMIRLILEKNQLELISFYAPNYGFSKLAGIDGYVLSVVPISKIDAFKKHQIELVNKLNYKK